jgi:membrane-bound lytic murein transglycosylase A
MPADQPLGGSGIAQQAAGQAGTWANTCSHAQYVPPGDDSAAKAFFEGYFAAYAIGGTAHISGYFEPEYPGSKNLAPGYTVPIYAKPADTVLANLPRAAIDDNALYRKAPVTAYLNNPVDAFMLQIYAAGRILLPDGRTLRVGFDGQNNAPYTPIGGILVAQGDLAVNDVTAESISAWLKSHPAQASGIMEENARYVFLRPLGDLPDDEGAPGALGVPITAGRTLAVDPTIIPLGLPVFVTTTNPMTGAPLDRLAIAQDTDAGIRGPAEAKLFFGAGPQAEATAGAMRQPGQLYLILPRPSPTS